MMQKTSLDRCADLFWRSSIAPALDKNCRPFSGNQTKGERRQSRHPPMLATPELALSADDVALSVA